MRRWTCMPILALAYLSSGCDSSGGKTVIPDQPLTEEQKAAIRADDQRVMEEEAPPPMKFSNP